MQDNSFQRNDEYFIHSYEVDLTMKLRFSALNRYMQESAWKNAEQLGFGFSSLVKKNLAWVLTRMVISIDHLPGWDESINIATWPSGKDSIFAFRDFQFFDKNQKELGRAVTSWCIIDLDSRKPVFVCSAFDHEIAEMDKQMFPKRPGKVESLSTVDSEWKTIVGYQDLDVNEHVTNSRYIDWIFESIDLEFLKHHKVRDIEINFLAEALYKKEIVVQTRKLKDTEFLHRIFQNDSEFEICRAKTVWK